MKIFNLTFLLLLSVFFSCQSETEAEVEGEAETKIEIEVEIEAETEDETANETENEVEIDDRYGVNQSLFRTVWKLEGIVEDSTCHLRVLYPQDTSNYMLEFRGNNFVSGFSSSNELGGSYCVQPSKFGINCNTQTNFEESLDGELFIDALNKADSYSLQDNELRLYYNDKSSYLLFKSCGCEPRTLACRNKVEIGENEYISMRIVPEMVDENEIPTLIFENQTSYIMTYGAFFTLEFFDDTKWMPIVIGNEEVDVAWNLWLGLVFPSETREMREHLHFFLLTFNQGKKGKYRIGKQFLLIEKGIYFLCCEFDFV